MKRRISANAILILSISIMGCSMHKPIVIENTGTTHNISIEDARKKVDYPGYLTGEGNIYSCHYGIHLYRENEIIPSKLVLLQSSLEQKFNLKGADITLNRFEIYSNMDPFAGASAAGLAGGLIGLGIYEVLSTDVAGASEAIYQEGKEIDLNRGTLSGCDSGQSKIQHGEFYVREVLDQHVAIVTYLNIYINGAFLKLRSVYPVKRKAFDREALRPALMTMLGFLNIKIEEKKLLPLLEQ